MPEAESAKTKNRQSSDKHRKTPSVTSEVSHANTDVGSILPSLESLMGNDFSGATFERHAALLGDPRMSQRMYDQQRTIIVQRLQRDYGNRYVQRLVDHIRRKRTEGIQTKLAVGPAGDRYEQEADRVAREVVRGIASSESREERVQRIQAETLAYAHRMIQRQQKAEMARLKASEEQPQVGMEGGEVTSDVSSKIEGARGSGQALPDNVRTQMEHGFGADFSDVKVHTGPKSDDLNESMSARAFTTGQDIFFKKGEYAPGSQSGKEILAHELTHVVQQNGFQRASDTEKPEDEELQLKPLQRQSELDDDELDEDELQLKPLQRQSELDDDELDEDELQLKPLQRQDAEGEGEPQTRAADPHIGHESGDVTPAIESDIHRAKGSGAQLPENLPTQMESAFGADSSDESLLTDARADELNRSIIEVARQMGEETERIAPHPSSNKQNSAYVARAIKPHEKKPLPSIPEKSVPSTPEKGKASSSFKGITVKDIPTGAKSNEGKSQPLTPEEQEQQEDKKPQSVSRFKKQKLIKSIIDGVSKLTKWVSEKVSENMELLVEYTTSSEKSIKNTVEAGELKAEMLGTEAAKESTVILKKVGAFFSSVAKKIGDVASIVGVVASIIGKSAGAILGVTKIWSSVLEGIKKFQEVWPLIELSLKKKKEPTTEFSKAVIYGAAKVTRSLVTRGIEVCRVIVQAVMGTVAGIASFFPGVGQIVALVATIGTILADVIKHVATLGSKIKGLYKWLKGKRGKEREKNAGIIVDTAIGDPGREQMEAAKLIGHMKPFGLLELLTADPNDIIEGLKGATEGEISKLKKGMANKLKSS